jgi:spore coat protein U-like protein
MRRVLLPAAVVAGTLFAAGPAFAQTTATGNFSVSMQVTEECAVTAGSLTFLPGATWWAGNVDTNGSFQVRCTNGTGYQIGLDTGSNNSGATRRMKHATNNEFIAYELYTATTRQAGEVWGNTPGGDTLQGQTGDGSAQSFTVYGRVPSGQTVPTAGNYTDTVTITVTY